MTNEFEQAFGQWLDGAEYNKAEEMLFQLLRSAFFAGWKAAQTQNETAKASR